MIRVPFVVQSPQNGPDISTYEKFVHYYKFGLMEDVSRELPKAEPSLLYEVKYQIQKVFHQGVNYGYLNKNFPISGDWVQPFFSTRRRYLDYELSYAEYPIIRVNYDLVAFGFLITKYTKFERESLLRNLESLIGLTTDYYRLPITCAIDQSDYMRLIGED